MAPTVALCQMAVEDLEVQSNLETVQARLSDLPTRTDVACFPELAITGFVPDDRLADVAVSSDGEVLDRLRELAARNDLDVLIGFAERANGTLFNSSAYVAADGSVATYRKRHRWGDERRIFARGEDRRVLETPLGRTGLLTCYDLNFVQESAALADARIEVLLVVGAWPANHVQNWRLLVRARALDGVRWAVGVARTGRRDVAKVPVSEYAGHSLVARPDGSVHAELGTESRNLVVDLDPSILERQRETIGIFED